MNFERMLNKGGQGRLPPEYDINTRDTRKDADKKTNVERHRYRNTMFTSNPEQTRPSSPAHISDIPNNPLPSALDASKNIEAAQRVGISREQGVLDQREAQDPSSLLGKRPRSDRSPDRELIEPTSKRRQGGQEQSPQPDTTHTTSGTNLGGRILRNLDTNSPYFQPDSPPLNYESPRPRGQEQSPQPDTTHTQEDQPRPTANKGKGREIPRDLEIRVAGPSHSHEGKETLNTIDSTIDALNLIYTFNLLSGIKLGTKRASDETKKHVDEMHNNLLILRVYSGLLPNERNKDKRLEVLNAYNHLKDYYFRNRPNERVKEWYQQIGFKFAQDAQATGPAQASESHETGQRSLEPYDAERVENAFKANDCDPKTIQYLTGLFLFRKKKVNTRASQTVRPKITLEQYNLITDEIFRLREAGEINADHARDAYKAATQKFERLMSNKQKKQR